MITRESIVAAARRWIGTPYHHQASLKGAGCDCLGLIRGVWRELHGPEPEALPPYTRDWGDVTGSEPLLAAARKYLRPADAATAQPGDVIVFRMQAGVAKHAGILVGALPASGLLERDSALPAISDALSRGALLEHEDLLERARFVHAQEGIGVTEVRLSRWWRRHIVAVFGFPGVK